MTTTTDLSEFESEGREMLEQLLKSWREYGLPAGFDERGTTAKINGDNFVYLENSENRMLALNADNHLEEYYSCPSCGYYSLLIDFEHAPQGEFPYYCLGAMEKAGLPQQAINNQRAFMESRRKINHDK